MANGETPEENKLQTTTPAEKEVQTEAQQGVLSDKEANILKDQIQKGIDSGLSREDAVGQVRTKLQEAGKFEEVQQQFQARQKQAPARELAEGIQEGLAEEPVVPVVKATKPTPPIVEGVRPEIKTKREELQEQIITDQQRADKVEEFKSLIKSGASAVELNEFAKENKRFGLQGKFQILFKDAERTRKIDSIINRFENSRGEEIKQAINRGDLVQDSEEYKALKKVNPGGLQEYEDGQKRQRDLDIINNVGRSISGEDLDLRDLKEQQKQFFEEFKDFTKFDFVKKFKESLESEGLKDQAQKVVEKQKELNSIDDNLKRLEGDVREMFKGAPESFIRAQIAKRSKDILLQRQSVLADLQAENGMLKNMSDDAKSKMNLFIQQQQLAANFGLKLLSFQDEIIARKENNKFREQQLQRQIEQLEFDRQKFGLSEKEFELKKKDLINRAKLSIRKQQLEEDRFGLLQQQYNEQIDFRKLKNELDLEYDKSRVDLEIEKRRRIKQLEDEFKGKDFRTINDYSTGDIVIVDEDFKEVRRLKGFLEQDPEAGSPTFSTVKVKGADGTEELYSFNKLTGQYKKERTGSTSNYTSILGNGRVTQYGGRVPGDNGLDIDGEVGDDIFIPMDGEVVEASTNPTFGTYVVVKDNSGNKVRYAHLNDAFVNIGDKVKSGSVIGTMGNTGTVLKLNGKAPSREELVGGLGSHVDITSWDEKGNPRDARETQQFLDNYGKNTFTESIKNDYKLLNIKPGDATQEKTKREKLMEGFINENDVERMKILFETTYEKGLQGKTKTDLEGRRESLQNIINLQKAFNEFTAAGGDTGFLIGQKENFLQNFGDTSNTELAILKNRMLNFLDMIARDRTGAALTAGEEQFYQRLLPGVDKNAELNNALFKSLITELELGTKGFIEQGVKQLVNEDTGKLLYGDENLLPDDIKLYQSTNINNPQSNISEAVDLIYND